MSLSLSLFGNSDDLPIGIGSDETGDFLSIMDYPLQFGLQDQDDENHSADRASCDECPMAVAFRLVSEDSVAGLGDVQDGAIPRARARVEDILVHNNDVLWMTKYQELLVSISASSSRLSFEKYDLLFAFFYSRRLFPSFNIFRHLHWCMGIHTFLEDMTGIVPWRTGLTISDVRCVTGRGATKATRC